MLINQIASPFIIAEIGSNHQNKYETAIEMLREAHSAGADAVKFQLFKADELYPPNDPAYDQVKPYELDESWLTPLINEAHSIGLKLGVSVFGDTSLELSNKYKFDFLKIASSEADNLPFLRSVLATNMPIIISTGMCDEKDIFNLASTIHDSSNRNVALLHCYSEYPLRESESRISIIHSLREATGLTVGFSDHTEGNISALVAVGCGALVFEKHITNNRSLSGPDHFYATEMNDFRAYVGAIRSAFIAYSPGSNKDLTDSERKHGRRLGLYAKRDLMSGEKLDLNCFMVKRPAVGIRLRDVGEFLGATLRRDLKSGAPILRADVK